MVYLWYPPHHCDSVHKTGGGGGEGGHFRTKFRRVSLPLLSAHNGKPTTHGQNFMRLVACYWLNPLCSTTLVSLHRGDDHSILTGTPVAFINWHIKESYCTCRLMQSGVGIGQEVCCSQQSPTVVIILTEVGGLHDVHRTVVDSTHKSNK